MDHAATIVVKDNKTVEYAEGDHGYGNEVDADQVGHMIVQKRAPSLRRRLVRANHVFGHGALGHGVSQQVELRLDSWRASAGVLLGHAPDQSTNIGFDQWSAGLAGPRFSTPIEPKTLAMPSDHSLRLHDDEGRAPFRPQSRQPRPEYSVTRTQLRLLARPL